MSENETMPVETMPAEPMAQPASSTDLPVKETATPAPPEAAPAAKDKAPKTAARAPGKGRAKPVLPAKVEKKDKPAKAEKPSRAEKVAKPAKVKLVRDSFTMPEGEYANLALLKRRALEAGVEVKKSELLRLGVQLLTAQPVDELLRLCSHLEKLKTGRPAKT